MIGSSASKSDQYSEIGCRQCSLLCVVCWCSLVHVRGNAINSLVLIGVIEKMEVPMWIVRMNASDEQWTSSIFYLFLFVIKDIYIDLI